MASFTATFEGTDELRALSRSLNAMPRAIRAEARRRSSVVAGPLAKAVQRAQGASPEGQVRRLASTVRTRTVRSIPTVTIGGLPYTYGAEYGGQRRVRTVRQPVFGNRNVQPYRKRTTMQFRRHRGTEGYEIGNVLRTNQTAVIEGYKRVIDGVADDFIRGVV